LSRYFDQKGEEYRKKIALTKDDEAVIDQLLIGVDRLGKASRLDKVKQAYFDTQVDASHLDGCLLFRDAVRSLTGDLGDAPAPNTPEFETFQLDLARHLFGWTCRQVTTLSQQGVFKNFPAHEVLRLGSGDAEDRVRVFLGLLHQSPNELDGCALIVKRQERQDGQAVTRHIPVLAGVLVGKQVYLFDPSRGTPVPGPDGKGVATLQQVKKSADLLKGMPDAPTAAQLGEAELVLRAELSGLAPRMRELQSEMEKQNNRVRLTEDLAERLKRFQAAGVPAKPWADPSRPGFPALTTQRYVENSKGDPRTEYVVHRDKLIPQWAIEAEKDIVSSGVLGYSLLTDFDRQFISLRLEPGGGRDLLVRGTASQAISKLVQTENLLDISLDQFHANLTQVIPRLRDMIVPALRNQSLIIRQLDARLRQTPSGAPDRPQLEQQLNETRRAYDSVWRESNIRSDIVNMNRDWAMPELREHLTYFMGLSKLELAIRSEMRLLRNPKAPWPEDLPRPDEQYASAAEWFRRYEAIVLPTGHGIWLEAVLQHRDFCDKKAQELRTEK
jgi:hypothetical protein